MLASLCTQALRGGEEQRVKQEEGERCALDKVQRLLVVMDIFLPVELSLVQILRSVHASGVHGDLDLSHIPGG